jgi:neutral ceramidase
MERAGECSSEVGDTAGRARAISFRDLVFLNSDDIVLPDLVAVADAAAISQNHSVFVDSGIGDGAGVAQTALRGCILCILAEESESELKLMFQAGEGVTDITPPLGIEMAGFHKPPGRERLIRGIRQPCAARALVLRAGNTETALISLEVIAFSQEFAQRIQRDASNETGIPASHIRVTASHSHSTPTFRFLRQWGAIPDDYMRQVAEKAVQATVLAKKDLAEASLYLGKERVKGGNFNRTTDTWKTDAEFTKESSDAERWLDTALHALYILREKPKRSLLWYHFSAHPVCYTDDQAGPDWPGIVAEKMKARDQLAPAFLEGHCGDVNPGDGKPWLGDPEKVSEAVYAALHHATNHSELVPVKEIKIVTGKVTVPFDLDLLRDQLARYEKDPTGSTKGEWVSEPFAKAWFESASKWTLEQTGYSMPVTALRLGEVGLLFHPAELYSFYGLAIRRDSPLPNTIVVGYTDDMIGYLTDPAAYRAGEYAAIVVPKILDLPPFKPEAAREFTAGCLELLRQVAG